jgi:hypothetical protein
MERDVTRSGFFNYLLGFVPAGSARVRVRVVAQTRRARAAGRYSEHRSARNRQMHAGSTCTPRSQTPSKCAEPRPLHRFQPRSTESVSLSDSTFAFPTLNNLAKDGQSSGSVARTAVRAMASRKRRRATTCEAPVTPIAWTLPAGLILEIVARSDRVSLIRSAAVP